MAEKKQELRLLVPAVLMLLIAVAGMTGIPFLLEAMLLMPVAAALLTYYCGWIGAAGVCAAAAVASAFVLPGAMLPAAFTWCAGTFAAACVPVKKPLMRPVLWCVTCLVTWGVALITLAGTMNGPVSVNMAQTICDLIDASPERDTILVNAYNMGWCRTDALVPTSRALGSIRLAEADRMQLLFSLRVSLEEMLPTFLCDALVYHTALTALLCTLLPDWRRRRKGEEGLLPSLDKWYMPRRMGRAVSALMIGWLISLLSQDGVSGYLGTLCSDIFRIAFMLQGICFLQWLGKRMGIKSTMRNIWSVVLSVLAPIVPIIVGMIDQRRDARHLRPNKEAEQE